MYNTSSYLFCVKYFWFERKIWKKSVKINIEISFKQVNQLPRLLKRILSNSFKEICGMT